MDTQNKDEASATTKASVKNINVTLNIEVQGLTELSELTEALRKFNEKGLGINAGISD